MIIKTYGTFKQIQELGKIVDTEDIKNKASSSSGFWCPDGMIYYRDESKKFIPCSTEPLNNNAYIRVRL